LDAIAGDEPFIMQNDGRGWLYVPVGLADGPLPVHYEPPESPFSNAMHGQQSNPSRKVLSRPENRSTPRATRVAATSSRTCSPTYRLTEHHTAGGMSRLPALPVRAAAGVLLRGQP
jgi:formate dehydrogenase major subunit